MGSIKFNNIYINNSLSVAGPMEKIGQIKNFDYVMDDYYFGTDTFEQAEIKMQRTVLDKIIGNNDIDILIGGDLSNQIAISNYVARMYDVPFLGIYSACATFVESLIIASNMIMGGGVNCCATIVSSHNLTSEKQFRYPIEYGAPRKLTSTFTTTGAVGTIVSNIKGNIKLESCTIGKVFDMGISDVNNMGAIMAYAAVDTLVSHLKELKRDVSYYDLIMTGDLGEYGSQIFLECLKSEYGIMIDNYKDAGMEIFASSQDTYAGGSGPVAMPLVLFNKILKNKKLKRILIIATGSLHSVLMVNQKNTVPAVAHAVSLEVLK